jgi:hypothetical protein
VALEKGYVGIVALLLEERTNLCFESRHRQRTLPRAAEKGNEVRVKLLLEKGSVVG